MFGVQQSTKSCTRTPVREVVVPFSERCPRMAGSRRPNENKVVPPVRAQQQDPVPDADGNYVRDDGPIGENEATSKVRREGK